MEDRVEEVTAYFSWTGNVTDCNCWLGKNKRKKAARDDARRAAHSSSGREILCLGGATKRSINMFSLIYSNFSSFSEIDLPVPSFPLSWIKNLVARKCFLLNLLIASLSSISSTKERWRIEKGRLGCSFSSLVFTPFQNRCSGNTRAREAMGLEWASVPTWQSSLNKRSSSCPPNVFINNRPKGNRSQTVPDVSFDSCCYRYGLATTSIDLRLRLFLFLFSFHIHPYLLYFYRYRIFFTPFVCRLFFCFLIWWHQEVTSILPNGCVVQCSTWRHC